ncbi:MAG: autotransporter outer membrane beta-barrel domain-containing protein [Gammaproteobacteria bacterium]|nr:autotransporter outer membrane beta-barrel domain-containing protein [Gammaproteobacteria bacterium]
MTALNLTGIILKKDQNGNIIRWLPKVGVSYAKERQKSYTDSSDTAHNAQDITLGQLTFGTQVFLPVLHDTLDNAEFFAKVEAQWDFDDVGEIGRSDGTTYRPDDFGASVGIGLHFDVGSSSTLRVEAACESIGRDNYDQYTGMIRLDSYFHHCQPIQPLM